MCIGHDDPCQDDIGRINSLKTGKRRSRNRVRPLYDYPPTFHLRRSKKKKISVSDIPSIPTTIPR